MTKQLYKWVLFFLCLTPSLSHAVLLKVDDGGDAAPSTGGTMTLRMAVTAANPGDTILIHYHGNISLGANLDITKPMIIIGPFASHCKLLLASNVQIGVNVPGGSAFLSGVDIQGSGLASSTPAVRVFISTTFILRDCVVENNQNSSNGGGVFVSGTFQADNCTFMNNQSGLDGGGVYISNACSATFTNCTFSGNGAVGYGGAVATSGAVTFMHCTLRENGSTIDGRDVASELSGATVVTTNSIFYHSVSGIGDMYDAGGGSWASNGGNTFTANPPGGTISMIATDQLKSPAQVALNASPTVDGYGLVYWKLLSTSAAIDFGVTGSLPLTDCRRAPRILFRSAIKPDGGAVEFTPYTVTNNSPVLGAGSLRQALSDIGSGISPFYIEFNMPGISTSSWSGVGVSITSADVFIDGYSQPGSAVPGPGTIPGTVTPAICGYIVTGPSGDNTFNVTGTRCKIHGLDFEGVFNSGVGYAGGNNHEVFGCVFTAGVTSGIVASSVNGLQIGGDRHFQRNVFVVVTQPYCIKLSAVSNVFISGNFIGPNTSGNGGSLPHTTIGIDVMNSNHILIGGEHFRGGGNIISSLNTGININGNVSAIDIMGNFIGLGYNGLSGPNLDNMLDGIRMAGNNSSVHIGIPLKGRGNLIANNDFSGSGNGSGIKMNGATGDYHVLNNALGVDINNNPQPNNKGVWVLNSNGLNMGNGTPQAKNILVNSVQEGLRIEGNGSTGNYINKNFIGVNENNLPAPNHTGGIYITALAASNTILNNVVSQGLTTVKGIHVNVGGTSNDIAGNLVGTDTTGNVVIGNEYGIYVESTQDGTLIRSNLVSGNAKDGIYAEYTNTITMYSNIIGMTLTTSAPLSNSQNGININNGRQMFIGTTLGGNQIVASGLNGIRLQNVKNFNIARNSIGTTPSLMTGMGNLQQGILIDNGCDTGRIGMMGSPADSNIIMYNSNHGILVLANAQHIGINQNHIDQNGFLGISLQNGPTPLPNDLDDTDPVSAHGNAGQNYPALGGAANCSSTGTTNVYGTINVDAPGNYVIEFYSVPVADASGHGEGTRFLGSNVVTVPATLSQTFSFPVGTLSVGTNITATCSKQDAGPVLSTSEFSNVVTVLPSFTADASVTQNEFCYGGADGGTHVDMIGGVTPFTFNWIWVGAGSVGSVQDNYGLYAADYTCAVTDATGCTVYSDTITITQPAALVATPTYTDETCAGASNGTATVTPTGGTGPYNFNWTESSSTIYANSGLSSSPTGIAPGTVTMSVVDANGCNVSSSFTINTGIPVTALFTSDVTSVCAGGTVNFTDGSVNPVSWSWDFGDSGSSTLQNPSHTYTTAGTYTALLTITNGACTNVSTPVNIVVSAAPTANAGPDQQFCSTTDILISLAGTTTGATGQYWSATQIVSWAPDSTSLSTDAYFSGAAVSAGSMYFILTATSAGCSTSDSLYATFTPPHSAYAGSDISVCVGAPIVLNGSYTPSATTATWSGAGSFSPSTTTFPTVTYTPTAAEIAAGSATITMTTDPYGACAVASDAVVVTFIPGPTANAGTYSPVCNGSTLTLDGSGSTGATSYDWSTGGSTFSLSATTNITPTVTADYILTVSDGTCSDDDTVTITVTTPPDPSFSYPSAPFCVNDASEVPTTATAGGYFDNADVTGVTMNTSTGEIFPSACIPGTYHIYHQLSAPCLTYDTILVTINALPAVSVSEISGDTVMCPPDTLHFSGTPAGGVFTPILGLNTTTGEYAGYATLPGTHTITYTYTDVNGCTNSDNQDVVLNPAPPVSFTPTLASSYCPSDPAVYLTGVPSGGAFTLNGAFQGFSNFSYDPTTPGNDSIGYGIIDGTTGCGNVTWQVVTVQPAPATPILSPSAPYTFCATSPVTLTVTNPSTIVTWYSDAALTSVIATGTGISSSVLPAGTGTAYVSNSLGSGCASAPLSFPYTNYSFSGVSFGGPYQACPGSPTEIEMTLPANVLYAWLPDSGINDTSAIHPVVISQTTHTYTVFLQINSMPGCSTYDSVQVVVAPCSLDNVTNAFSPDGDGVNDTWIIAGIDQHPDNKVTVFNRWGDKLLHFSGYNNSTVVWDGKYKGTLVASGTYYFVIEYPDDGQHAAGWLQLNY